MAAVGIISKVYRPRNALSSPFHRLVTQYFDEFERIYPERYQETYGFWRPVIKTSIEKFIKCGDLKHGFARIRCANCGEERLLGFSCRQRCACPSCHQKRMLLLSMHLDEQVLARAPHRQFVFTIPKRLRVYFRFDRKLLGDLAKAAWETVRQVYGELGPKESIPAMIAGIQTYGDLINFNSHIHSLVPCGVFSKGGEFTEVDKIPGDRLVKIWRDNVFGLLLGKGKIGPDIVQNMKSWPHSGFSVDTSVRLEAYDRQGMRRMIEYMSRCPFSVARLIRLTNEGKVLYRASRAKAVRFPTQGDPKMAKGLKRNFEIFEPLDFLATVTQHIPNKGEHLIRYYGVYSNKVRGMKHQQEPADQSETFLPEIDMQELPKPFTATWAMLIKHVYESDPLQCPHCGEQMKVVSLIDQDEVIEKILRHCDLWIEPAPRSPPQPEIRETVYVPDEEYQPIDSLYV